jgi:hypothetical protein
MYTNYVDTSIVAPTIPGLRSALPVRRYNLSPNWHYGHRHWLREERSFNEHNVMRIQVRNTPKRLGDKAVDSMGQEMWSLHEKHTWRARDYGTL